MSDQRILVISAELRNITEKIEDIRNEDLKIAKDLTAKEPDPDRVSREFTLKMCLNMLEDAVNWLDEAAEIIQ